MKIIDMIKDWFKKGILWVRAQYDRAEAYLDADKKRKKRVLVFAFGLIFFFDYVFFCALADKNFLDVFPVIPVHDNRKEVTVFVPDVDAKTIMPEKRVLDIPKDKALFVKELTAEVIKGSRFENTSVIAPINRLIRKVWFYNDTCVIDMSLTMLDDKSLIIPGSESSFRQALEQTVVANVPSVKKVEILAQGLPARNIYEYNAENYAPVETVVNPDEAKLSDKE